MKDISIGMLDGDPVAFALAKRISDEQKRKYITVYDKDHRLFYGFYSFSYSECKAKSVAFFKYTTHCRANNYASMDYCEFKNMVKFVSRSEYMEAEKTIGSRFKDL